MQAVGYVWCEEIFWTQLSKIKLNELFYHLNRCQSLLPQTGWNVDSLWLMWDQLYKRKTLITWLQLKQMCNLCSYAMPHRRGGGGSTADLCILSVPCLRWISHVTLNPVQSYHSFVSFRFLSSVHLEFFCFWFSFVSVRFLIGFFWFQFSFYCFNVFIFNFY